MIGTTIAKGQIPDIRWTYTKGIINLRESLMIRSTSCPWAWTQGSRSTPTSSMHNLSFTSHFRRSCNVEILYSNTRRVWLVKTFEFTHIKEGIGSTHRGIEERYTTNFGLNITSSKEEHCSKKQRIQFTKGIMYPRKSSQAYLIWSTLSDKIRQKGLVVHKGSDVSIGTQLEEANYRNNWLTQLSNAKELWFPNQGIRSNALIRGG